MSTAYMFCVVSSVACLEWVCRIAEDREPLAEDSLSLPVEIIFAKETKNYL